MGSPAASNTLYSNKTVMGLPAKKEFMFTSAKGVEKKGIKKRQTELLKKLEFLQRFLRPDEEIYLVTTGCSPISLLEQLTTGLVVFYIRRAFLVFTNKRILHIPTTVGYKFRHSISQINFNDCASLDMSWGTLKVKYKNGKKENFIKIGGGERAKIKQFLQKLNLKSEPSKHKQRFHRCPSCARSLTTGVFSCPACKLEFKSRSRAMLLSLLIPGGGYFYTGHWFLGLMDFVVEAGLTLLAIVTVVQPDPGDPDPASTAMFLLVILAIEKLITIYHAVHYVGEFIPVHTNYKQRVAA